MKEKDVDCQADKKSQERLGKKLRKARELLNLETIDIADQLFISHQIVKSIENDAYKNEDLKDIFLRGYIRSYARLVKLPDADIEEAFLQMGVLPKINKQLSSHVVSVTPSPFAAKSKAVRFTTYLIIAVFVILVLTWHYSHRSSETNLIKPIVIEKDTAQQKPNDVTLIASDASSEQQSTLSKNQSETAVTDQSVLSKESAKPQDTESSDQVNKNPKNKLTNKNRLLNNEVLGKPLFMLQK